MKTLANPSWYFPATVHGLLLVHLMQTLLGVQLVLRSRVTLNQINIKQEQTSGMKLLRNIRSGGCHFVRDMPYLSSWCLRSHTHLPSHPLTCHRYYHRILCLIGLCNSFWIINLWNIVSKAYTLDTYFAYITCKPPLPEVTSKIKWRDMFFEVWGVVLYLWLVINKRQFFQINVWEMENERMF